MDGAALVIQGKKYTSKNLHLLPEPLTGYNVSKKESDTHIGFFGELNPLSNFHEAEFTVDGITFHSTEQYIQYQKAKLFGDKRSSSKILESTTPLECKKLSKEILNYDPTHWWKRVRICCEQVIYEKFLQNPILLKLLVSTADKIIVECAYDHLWGSGIPLHEDNCFTETDWSGDNLLGNILMKVRGEHKEIIGGYTSTGMIT